MSMLIDLTDECTVLVHPDMDAMQSTCNGLHPGNPHDGMLSELSTISSIVSAQSDTGSNTEHQQLKVYLRVRPFSQEELACDEDKGCIVLADSESVKLQAPKGSATMKSSEKGIGRSVHKFSFSQIFGSGTSQATFFENTIKSQVLDYLEGKNALIFTYGVTNAGKTYTIQGSPKDPGILPRALDVIFDYIKGKQYDQMDLKPYLSCDVQYLGPDQVKQERNVKAAVFSLLKEENDQHSKSSSSSSTSFTSSISFSSVSYDQTVDSTDAVVDKDRHQFAVWVAFYEIYNEFVYDLLESLPCVKAKKRSALRVCEDSVGNSYVRDLKWINVHSSEEAWRVLKIGNRNRSAASTKLNQSSSRSHSIFAIKLLRITGTEVSRVTELSLCDLAGSERCTKTKTFGERLKEAGNINNSLLILGKCIAALRNNQSDRIKGGYVPFRESKLTRLFQSIFCGKGRACMIVNINQCASTYDETLHVMKFSAVAKQVVQIVPPKSLECIAPKLVGPHGKALLRNGIIDEEALDSYLSEDELLDDEDEGDMSILPQEDLLGIIENLKEKLLAERRRNLVQEIEIRKEMGDAMLQQLMESEELQSRKMAELKESYQEKLENTFELYKDALKEHAYQCALERVEEEYIPVDEFIAEQEKVEELKVKLSEAEQRLRSLLRTPSAALSSDQACQCSLEAEDRAAAEKKYEEMYQAKCAVEELCGTKDEVITSLEKQIQDLAETIQEAGESFMEKEAELEKLQKMLSERDREIDGLRRDLAEQDRRVSLLSEEQALRSKESPTKRKTRKGLLANLKESVTSPRKGALGRTMKSVKATPVTLKKKPFL
uniref:Kinesin-like protein n=1 Tax=Paramormyrops kingsleyae TaxID=1676925 RepID=A0A3B3SEK7_9TELE|nr:kinesin-like protein KIF20A [Paramormyrops kingsleyae]